MTPTTDEPRDASGPDVADEYTGLPVFRTWPALYVFVAIVFAGWVAFLCALSSQFS